MRVNYLTPNLNISGGVKVKLEHCTRLADRGHKVTLVITKKAKPKQKWFPLSKRVKIVAIDHGKLKSKLSDADVLIANHWPYCQKLPLSKGKLLVPRQIEEPVTDDQIAKMSRKPDLWLPNSAPIESILHSCGLSNTCVVQNGVNHEWFNPQGQQNAMRIFTQLNLKKRRKGGPETLHVLERIHRDYPDVDIWGFGQKSSSKYGKIPSWMHFFKVGPRDLPNLYRQCGIYFYASLLDGFANSVAEAMACGCIVVTSKNAGVPFAANKKTAITFTPGSNKEALKGLKSVLDTWKSNQSRWQAMRAIALKEISQYTWRASVDQLEHAMRIAVKSR